MIEDGVPKKWDELVQHARGLGARVICLLSTNRYRLPTDDHVRPLGTFVRAEMPTNISGMSRNECTRPGGLFAG